MTIYCTEHRIPYMILLGVFIHWYIIFCTIMAIVVLFVRHLILTLPLYHHNDMETICWSLETLFFFFYLTLRSATSSFYSVLSQDFLVSACAYPPWKEPVPITRPSFSISNGGLFLHPHPTLRACQCDSEGAIYSSSMSKMVAQISGKLVAYIKF